MNKRILIKNILEFDWQQWLIERTYPVFGKNQAMELSKQFKKQLQEIIEKK